MKQKLDHNCSIILKTCMNAKKSDKILILCDKDNEDIGKAFKRSAESISKSTKYLNMPVLQDHGQEPSKDIAKNMLGYDIILMPTSKSLSHTDARRMASLKGTRIASMPTITKDIINRCIDIDYQGLKTVHERLRNILRSSKVIRIKTDKGTDLKTAVKNIRGDVAGLLHNKGDFGNLPTGEVDSGIIKEKTYGTVVIDKSFAAFGKLDSPLTFKINKGIITDIKGKRSKELKNMLDKIGKKAYIMAELGIGTNPKAKVTGIILEDEKVKGTVHIAIGNDITYGGDNNAPIHLDGIIGSPTLYCDDKIILDNGKLIL